ncbi:MAG TPA: hypothetical protein VFD58_05295 [Blastocatellia bacterium]|nr:hypothetical protein [Blastocatellia bacterium]
MKAGFKFLLVMSALIIAAVVYSNPQKIRQALPPGLNHLSEARLVEVKDADGKVILTGHFPATGDHKNEIERTATLAGTGVDPDAKGKAEIELVKKDGGFAKEELEITVERLAPSAGFRLYVDGNEVSAFTTSRGGKASLKFSSRYGKK